eukprot:s190_g4.t2
MLAGTDYRCLYSLGVIASPGCEPVLSWSRHSASGKSLGRRRGHEVRSGIFSRASAVLLGVWLGGTQPLCVWAAPKGLPALLAVTEAIAARVPEHLPDGGDAGSDSRGHIGSVDRATDEPWSVLVARMQEQALLEAYGEHLDPPSLRFLFLKPGFPDEVVPLRDLPEDPAAALRDAASGLDVGLYDQPMIPVEAEAQPWPGIMTALQVPCWVPISTTAIIILDLTAVGGPLFSSFVPALLTFRDLADFASAYTQLEWEVYQPSDVIPLISSFSQLVTSGQVFRTKPVLPPVLAPHEWLVVQTSRCTAIHHMMGDGPALQVVVAESMYRAVENVSFGRPHTPTDLAEVRYQGRAFLGIIAADPRSESIPPGPNLGAFVFLDARRVVQGLSSLFTDPGPYAIDHIFRLVGARPPNGFVPVIVGVAVGSSHVTVADGDVLILDYAADWGHTGGHPHTPAVTVLAEADEPPHTENQGGVGSSPGVPATGLDVISGPAYLSEADPGEAVSEPTSGANAWFVAFAPQCAPEYIGVILAFPTSPEDAAEVVSLAREDASVFLYEHQCVVYPVYPQPRPLAALCSASQPGPPNAFVSWLIRLWLMAHIGVESFRAHVAQLLQYPLHCVVLASAQLPYLPVPPGRVLPVSTVYFLDLRPILGGFQYGTARAGKVLLQAPEQRFSEGLPEGYSVLVHGGCPALEQAETVLYVSDREVLRVEFCKADAATPLRDGPSEDDSSGSSSSPSSDSDSAPDDDAPPTAEQGSGAAGRVTEGRRRNRKRPAPGNPGHAPGVGLLLATPKGVTASRSSRSNAPASSWPPVGLVDMCPWSAAQAPGLFF